MKFDDLNGFRKELIAEAYQSDLTWRFRVMVATPICAAVVAVIWWFVARDGDSYGLGIVEFVAVGFLCLLSWMGFEAISARRVKWAVRSFELSPVDQKELLASLSTAPGLAAARRKARSAIGAELQEGARQAADRL